MTPISCLDCDGAPRTGAEHNDLLEESVGYATRRRRCRPGRRDDSPTSPLPMWAAGRAVTVERWFDWLDAHGPPDPYPPAAVQWAWLRALTGHPADAERWADAAERASFEGPCLMGVRRSLPGSRSSVRCCVAMGSTRWPTTRGSRWKVSPTGASSERQPCSCSASRRGSPAMRKPPTLRWRTQRNWENDTGRSPPFRSPWPSAAVFAMERGDWAAARTYAQAARKVVEEGGLQDYMTSILTYATAAPDRPARGRRRPREA